MDLLIQLLLEPFLKYEFLQRALIASVIVGVTCGIIGSFVILRGMALVGDAISHAVFPGVVVGYAVAGQALFSLFLGALIAGLLCMILIGVVERNTRLRGDTATGVIFTAFFAFGVLLISQMKKVHLDLNGYLFGDVLGVSGTDLWFIASVGPLAVLIIWLCYKELVVCSFDPIFADCLGIRTGVFHYLLMLLLTATVVTSLQAVGLVLVVSMLITPGATAFMLTQRLPSMLGLAALFGSVAAIVGLILSYHLNVASGAAMVLVGFVQFSVVFLIAPGEGVVAKLVRKWRRVRQIQLEDFLKASLSIEATAGPVTIEKLATKLDLPTPIVRPVTERLVQQQWIKRLDPIGFELTPQGTRKALGIIRAHRLWETYLNQKAGLSWDRLDADAERIEHLLTPEMVDALDESLGRPATDPHGAPIPTAEGTIDFTRLVPLLGLSRGDRFTVRRIKDDDPLVLRDATEARITIGSDFIFDEHLKSTGTVRILSADGTARELKASAAENVLVARESPAQ